VKAATGELNLTVVTLIAIGLIVSFFTAFLWPQIRSNIKKQWEGITKGKSTLG
jgi:F0F1-type ATP synthase membrane subunit b/b'